MSIKRIETECPGCHAKVGVNYDVPDHIVDVKEDTAKIQSLTKELATLTDDANAQAHELEAWQSMSKHRPVGEILQHLGECPNCRPELDQFVSGIRKKAIAEVTPEQAKEIAKVHKLWPPPSVDLGPMISSKARP